MGEVVELNVPTTLDIPVQRILDGAQECEVVLVIGWDSAGELYTACSVSGVADMLLLIEKAKQRLLAD